MHKDLEEILLEYAKDETDYQTARLEFEAKKVHVLRLLRIDIQELKSTIDNKVCYTSD